VRRQGLVEVVFCNATDCGARNRGRKLRWRVPSLDEWRSYEKL